MKVVVRTCRGMGYRLTTGRKRFVRRVSFTVTRVGDLETGGGRGGGGMRGGGGRVGEPFWAELIAWLSLVKGKQKMDIDFTAADLSKLASRHVL